VTGVDTRPNEWSVAVDDVTVEADLLNGSVEAMLPNDIDLIVHLAANARVHKLVEDPRRARDNFETTFNVLEYARKHGVEIVFGSSREVYGSKRKTIYNETETYIDECESPYTASKVGGEAMVKSYQQCYDIESCILRFSNVYGRYDASDRVVPKFIAQAFRGEDLVVYGDDKVLDFTHLDDCVDGIYRAVDQFHKAKGTTFNIASGEGTSLSELAEHVTEHVSTSATYHVEPSRVGEINRFVADISKAEKILGYDPSHSMVDGVDETISWYETNDQLFDKILDADEA
jgi:UDP-glucose 4-epimerase